jgi:DNA-binding transcriptional ArsR family regulator
LTLTEERLDAAFSAMADPTRRAIVTRLSMGEATVKELAEPFAISVQAVSRHIRVLEKSGLISQRVDAQRRPCRLEIDTANELINATLGGPPRRPRSAPRTGSSPGVERMSASTSRDDRRGEFTISRVVDAPRDLVWRAFTEPEHLAAFWGEPGITVPVESVAIEVRHGAASS